MSTTKALAIAYVRQALANRGSGREGGEAPQSSARTSDSSSRKRIRSITFPVTRLPRRRRRQQPLPATAEAAARHQDGGLARERQHQPEGGAEEARGGGEGNQNDLRLPAAPDAPPAQEGGEEGDAAREAGVKLRPVEESENLDAVADGGAAVGRARSEARGSPRTRGDGSDGTVGAEPLATEDDVESGDVLDDDVRMVDAGVEQREQNAQPQQQRLPLGELCTGTGPCACRNERRTKELVRELGVGKENGPFQCILLDAAPSGEKVDVALGNDSLVGGDGDGDERLEDVSPEPQRDEERAGDAATAKDDASLDVGKSAALVAAPSGDDDVSVESREDSSFDGTVASAAELAHQEETALEAAAGNGPATLAGLCNNPKCQDMYFRGECRACAGNEAIDDASVEDNASVEGDDPGASVDVTEDQLARLAGPYCGVSLFVRTRGTIGPSAYQAKSDIASKQVMFAATFGTPTAASFVVDAAKYCTNGSGCILPLDARLRAHLSEVELITRYLDEQSEQGEQPLLATRENDILAVLRSASELVDSRDFAKKLRDSGKLVRAKLTAVQQYFQNLALLTQGQIDAIRAGADAELMRQHELPWVNSAQQIAEVFDAATGNEHGRNIYSDYESMYEQYPLLIELLSGETKNGNPGWHPALSTATNVIGNRSNQDEEVDRRMGMKLTLIPFSLLRHLLSPLAPEAVREEVETHISQEWRDMPGMHPEITADNVYEVADEARQYLSSFLRTGKIGGQHVMKHPDLVDVLSVLRDSPGSDPSAIKRTNAEIESQVNDNRNRLIADMEERSKTLALLEVEKVKLYKLFDEGVRPIFAWIDSYRTQSEGGDGKSLEEFLDELSDRLETVDISPEDIEKVLAEGPDSNAWANRSRSNVEDRNTRNEALGRMGCFILKALAGVCYGGCGRRLLDMPNSASDIDHEDRDAKTKNPSKKAKEEGLVALLDETLDTLCTPKCHECHDRGTDRGYTPEEWKNHLLIAGEPRTHASRLTPSQVVLREAIPFVQIAVLIAESYAGDWRNRGSDMAQVRGSTLCITGIVLDGLVMFGGRQWNGDNIDHLQETDRILERVVVMSCGCCLNPNCPNENDGDLTQKSAFANYGYVHDHNGKKSETISNLLSSKLGPLRFLSEMCSWTDVLCFICNARRTANQKRGCKERCFKDVGTDCDCDECDDDDAFPTRVTWS